METRKRESNRRSRLWAITLAALLACALMTGTAAAAPATGAVVIPDEAAPKPVVSIVGNVVVDKNKPTGFYELSLRVKTARTIVTNDGNNTPVSEEDYLAAIEADPNNANDYIVTNYPFQSAAAAVYINLDALSPVTWGAGKPIYDTWEANGATGTTGSYKNFDTGYEAKHPRGIDLDNPDQPNIFTDLDSLINGKAVSVRLDTANPDEMTNATALIESYDRNSRIALLTLSANTTTTANVVYPTETEVVVVRFAYDLNRFKNTDVTEPNQSDFWMDVDRNTPRADGPNNTGKTPLTYLEASNQSGDLHATADHAAAESSIHQTVWYTQNLISDNEGQRSTNFYYYLGADTNPASQQGQKTYTIIDNGAVVDPAPTLTVPKTEGNAVLAKRNEEYKTFNDPETGNYSFFQNLLTTFERTLILRLENAETYRKPTGGIGGAQILFYDWDDSLIGALVVDPEGDARAAVNEYVERVMIHPELRTSANIDAAADLDTLKTDQDYMNRVNSLERQHTYRGEYAYQVGQDNDDSLKVEDGGNYPLTNKLDYAFYRRMTTQTEVKNAGTGVTTRYFTTDPVSGIDGVEDYDGYLYPYVNGWAIVEDDTQDLTKDNWILHKDSVKTEDVWTTFGVGELGSMDPSANNGTGTFVDPADGQTKGYSYAVTDQDAGWYLKFADFSAMEKLLREGQDVVIVKAVYEPGDSLLEDYNYTVIDGSLHVERYSYAASTEASVYSFQYQYRRANLEDGVWHGVNRTREPAVQTGYTYDVNAFDDKDKALDLDPMMDTNVFFLKTLANNDDILNIDMTTGGVLWKLDYFLVDTYSLNISTGVQRSAGEELDLKNNFLYTEGVEYPDRQGTNGFVLEATLNTLLAEATKGARGEENTLSRHMSINTLTDMNWRANIDGTAFTWGNYTRVTTYFQDLVTRLYNAGVSIDPKTGDVKLGWHQIQRHILLCMQAGGVTDGIFSGGVLMNEDACAGFSWCRLDDCGLIITVDIYDLGDIFVALDKAKSETGDKHPAKDALDELLTAAPGASLLDGYLNQFRKDEDGRKFKTRQEMMNALKDVYDILSGAGLDQDALKAITAEQVQEIIITGKYPTTGKTYWWWNNGKRPVSTWKDFIEAGMLVVSGDVPDALDGMTNTNLPNAVQDMISYAAPTGSPANVGWFRYKDSDEDDNAFTDVEQFKAKWLTALSVLDDHYNLPDDWNTIPWAEIQYALINGSYADATTVVANTNYWWRDGGLPKLTFEKLMEAINKYKVEGDASEIDRLLAKGVNPLNNEVYIRRTAAGSGFTSAAQFKTMLDNTLSMINFASNSGTYIDYAAGGTLVNLTPHQLQYILLNSGSLLGGAIPSDADVKANYNYWWIDPPHIPTSAQNINDIMDLLTYAYWKRDGVDGNALNFALDRLDAATMERLHLRAEGHGMPYTDETNADLVTAVLAVLNKLPYTIDTIGSQTAADLTKEVQYLLLNPGAAYKPAGSITDNYWWQGSGFEAETHETLAQAAWLAVVGFNNKTAPDAMNQITDLDFITRRETIDAPGMAMRNNLDGAAFTSINAFKSALTGAVQSAIAADPTLTYDDLTGMTNYQLQYLLLNGVYKSDADVKAEVIADGKDAYWWFTADKPPEPDVKKEPIEIDPAEWDAFLESAIAYYKKTAGNPSGFVYDLTDAKLKDVLRLRKGPNDSDVITASEMFTGDKTDLLWQVMSALHTSNRKAYFITGAATNRKWVNKPTWAEFQYVLLHLNDVAAGWIMPETEECENAKDGYDWMWTVSGKVEYERVLPDATEWDSFLESAIAYYKKTAGNPSGFVYDLTDAKIENVLLLRKDNGDPITASEMFAGNKADLVWQVLSALHTSNRKAEFITGAATNRKWVNKPTWAEFQYVLLHLNDVAAGWIMPTTAECEEWATQENVSWVWQEKAAGASLFALEPAEDEWLEDEPIPLSRFSPDETPPNETPPDETPPERADKDNPGASPAVAVDEAQEIPVRDEVQEIPMGDEAFADRPMMLDNQGGYAA